MMSARAMDWVCPRCGAVLGRVIHKELHIVGEIGEEISANTSGSDLVVRCLACDYIKVWYRKDPIQAIVDDFASAIGASIVKHIGRLDNN